ncbi:DUF3341 domain-containing protein [Bdellovibrio sp. SKB1291214]|uniref:DUF3341 domain-containing protein n=1 Tax=Bdellovibrio sp. SKB1291214 TaxID=1732569 RepID=UPI000B51B5C9|nr:DUF3341 domain-containing protein [Bdellovibrio sp. SKB1291214]UYL08421.1 DUF3341 domain-containing protein [Bdellovibrio sp. SKB1291214]
MAAQYTKGIAGIWLEESKILKAAAKMRDSGSDKFEAISAYPIHGMEEACGIKRSWIPYVTFVAGCLGLSGGLALTYWTSAVDWAVNVGGKPFFSAPAFVPIMFELTILLAALSSVGALFYACKMPRIDPPIIDPDLSCHKFAIFVPHNDATYDETKLTALFKELGAVEVKKTEY